MLWLAIMTWGPENRGAITERFMEKGHMIPESIKVLGLWTDLQGGRSFTMVEGDDPTQFLISTMNWDDISNIEYVPLMAAEDVAKILAEQAGT